MIQREFKSLFCVVAFLSAFQVGCTSSDDAPKTNTNNVVMCDGKGEVDRFGIVGGQTLSQDSNLGKGVVYIVTSYYEKRKSELLAEASCTGALVDSNIVLTAAHCFEPPEFEDIDAEDTGIQIHVYTGFRPFCKKKKNADGIAADTLEINENYFEQNRTGDIALVRLEQQMPGSHTFYSLDGKTHDFVGHEKLVAVGYGKTNGFDGKESDDRPLKFGFLDGNKDPNFQSEILAYFMSLEDKIYNKFVEEALADERSKALRNGETFGYAEEQEFKRKLRQEMHDYVASVTPKFEYSDAVENLVFDQSKRDGVCAGDSGGPGLRQEGDRLRIVGVAQAVFSYKSWVDQCNYGSIYTNVAFHKNWIVEKFNSLSNSNTTFHKSGEELFQ